MNAKVGSLKINTSREIHRRLIKSIEDGGFVLVLDHVTSTGGDYIIASNDESDWNASVTHEDDNAEQNIEVI